jgi:hypothetical protein
LNEKTSSAAAARRKEPHSRGAAGLLAGRPGKGSSVRSGGVCVMNASSKEKHSKTSLTARALSYMAGFEVTL